MSGMSTEYSSFFAARHILAVSDCGAKFCNGARY